MKRETIWSGVRIFILSQLTILGLLSILATGGSSGPKIDKPGALAFDNGTYAVTEGPNTTVTITVIRTGGSDGAASVVYTTSSGTAAAPGDYITASDTLDWAAGDATSKTFNIVIVNDSTPENQEAFTVSLSNAVGAGLGTAINATVTINDDDIVSSPGELQFENTGYSVTEGADSTVTISVTRSLGSAGAASVQYDTANGLATAPGDYTAVVAGTLSWTDGEVTAKTFDVLITDDSAPELIESFTVNLSTVMGASLGANTSTTVTIIDNDKITGKVFAPGGVLAFREPGLLERMFAALFGTQLKAEISDLVSPVPAVTVNLHEIDADGVVGGVIDTATTDGTGEYILSSPPLDVPAVKYIVRAEGAVTMDSRVTSLTVDVDPATDATSNLVTTIASDLADLALQEVKEMQADAEDLIPFIVTTDSPTATQLSDRLQAQALRMGGRFRILNSKVSSGRICGLVTSPSGVPLSGIDIVVREYSDWRMMAKSVTDAIGSYCVNVPLQDDTDPDGGTFDGEYIIGAFNYIDTTVAAERYASQWRNSSGTTYSRLEASKISVTSGVPVVNFINMQLADGATVTGTVKASGSGINLEGVDIVLSDFENGIPMAIASVEADGTYRVSVIPGTYRVEAVNTTQAAYASLFYDGVTGTNLSNMATPVNVAVGTMNTIDFTLEPGAQLTGTITDGTTSNPVARTRVRIDLTGDANYGSEFTDRYGYYHIWLRPGNYDVYAYGQNTKAVNLGAAGSTVPVDFSASVSRIQGVLQDGSSNPVKHAKLRLYDSAYEFTGFEVGNSNGAFTSYTDQTGDHFLEIRIDRTGTSAGSTIYNGITQLEGGDAITIASVGDNQDLSTITLPAGGLLKGNVYADDLRTTPGANFRVQVRDGGVLPANKFLTVRTRGDGSYLISLPATTYERVKMLDATNADTGNGNCNNISVVAGSTTVLNYIDDSNTCEINP